MAIRSLIQINSANSKNILISGATAIAMLNWDDAPAASFDAYDYDGNGYNNIIINGLTWLKQASQATKTRDGTIVQYFVQNSGATTGTTYGKMYKWGTTTGATNSTNIAPVGYHVATQSNWYNLLNYIASITGGTSSDGSWNYWNAAGSWLKATGTTYWSSPNVGAYDATGFTLKGGGYMLAPPTWDPAIPQQFLTQVQIWAATAVSGGKGDAFYALYDKTFIEEPKGGQQADIAGYIYFVKD